MTPPLVYCCNLPAADLLVRGAHVVDPLAGIDAVRDVLVRKGIVTAVGESVEAPSGVRVIDAAGRLLLPGFVDLHTHTRVPGREDEEDIESVTRAAAAGGYVAIFAMANTDPAVDNAPVLESLQRKAQTEARVPVGFFAAVTRGLLGGELTDMGELAQAGAIGFSDDGRPLASAHILRRAMQYLKVTDRFIAVHAQDDSLMGAGVMHEGAVSARLGLAGIPAISESIDIARALEIAEYEGARLHVCHVSTARSLEHLTRARAAGLNVTAEAAPHHLALTDEAVASLDSNLKMNPPLRPESDRKALIEALRSGVVDCIATDHAPHAQQEKEVPFEEATFGTVGLETAFAVVHAATVPGKRLTLAQLVDRMSQAPARIAGIAEPTIQPKRAAGFCLIDPRATWQVTAAGLHSKSANSAWLGATLKGRVEFTVAAGRLVWEAGA